VPKFEDPTCNAAETQQTLRVSLTPPPWDSHAPARPDRRRRARVLRRSSESGSQRAFGSSATQTQWAGAGTFPRDLAGRSAWTRRGRWPIGFKLDPASRRTRVAKERQWATAHTGRRSPLSV